MAQHRTEDAAAEGQDDLHHRRRHVAETEQDAGRNGLSRPEQRHTCRWRATLVKLGVDLREQAPAQTDAQAEPRAVSREVPDGVAGRGCPPERQRREQGDFDEEGEVNEVDDGKKFD